MSSSVRGQASVELVGVLPLVVLLALVLGQLLAAGAARELAGNAAEAGATALLQRRDPSGAARDALPGWSRRRMSIAVDGRVIRVALRPPGLLPGLGAALEAHAAADAGPAS
jgi:hypothetical protein